MILIQTRTAKGGSTQVSVNHRTTIGQFTDKLNVWRNPLQMAQIANEELTNAGLPALYTGQYNNGTYYPSLIEIQQGKWSNTDWADLCMRTAVVNNTTATLSHSTDKAAINLSLNYFDDEGVYKKDNFRKGNVTLNGSYKLAKNFTLQTSNILSIHKRHVNNTLEYGRNPLWPVYDEDGNYFVASETDFGHPLIISDNVKNETQGRDLISSLAAEWEIVEGLKIRTQLNYNYSTSVQDVYNASNTSQEAHDMNGIAQMNNSLSQDVLSETYVTFQRTFADRHNLSVMAGHSFDYNMGRTLGTTAYDFVNDALGNENMGAGNPQKNVINNTYQNSKLLSFYGRLNYVLDDKYLFTFTMRADGSSKFGKNNKWGYFPSGAVSWKLHNEPWMKKLNVFDEFKIRASWGISGNQGISPYQTLNRYGTEKYWFADKWQTAIGPGYEAGREGANDRYIVLCVAGHIFLRRGVINQNGIRRVLFHHRLAEHDDGLRAGIASCIHSCHFAFSFLNVLTPAITSAATRPMITAALPPDVGPFAEDARPKLWQKAAPARRPNTVTALSLLPSPERISCRSGQPPRSTQAKPVSIMPRKFQRPSVCATGWSAKPRWK